MNRSPVECAVARATGESLSTIKRLGFSMAEPAAGWRDDPTLRPNIVDWDVLQRDRIGLFPNRQLVRVTA